MYARRTRCTESAAFDAEIAEAAHPDVSNTAGPQVDRLFDPSASSAVEDGSPDATPFILGRLRNRPVLSRAAERELFQEYDRASRRLERVTTRSPVVARILVACLLEASVRPEALHALMTPGPGKDAPTRFHAEVAEKAIVAIDAVLDDIWTAPSGSEARLRVWLGRAVRAVGFTRAALSEARAEALAAADRAVVLVEETHIIMNRLEGPTPSVADKRRYREIELELRSISGGHGISIDALVAFGEEARRAERAREVLLAEIVESNLRLVVSVVKGFARYGLPLADLIQEGTLGLMHAAEKFEWRRGNKFSTYAIAWIRQVAQRALDNQARTIRLPVHASVLLRRVNCLQRDAIETTGREMTAEEAAAALELPITSVRAVQRAPTAPIPLDAPLAGESPFSLADTIVDRAARPDEILLRADLRAKIEEALVTLAPREQTVIRMRFGLGDGMREHTLEEIARAFGVTRERVRQVEVKALEKLREPRRSAKLRHYA
jgi:RNA polymerase primary sigma factor